MSKQNKFEELDEILEQLESLIQERIAENNTIGIRNGLMTKQFTHCFMYYRQLIWDAQELAKKLK